MGPEKRGKTLLVVLSSLGHIRGLSVTHRPTRPVPSHPRRLRRRRRLAARFLIRDNRSGIGEAQKKKQIYAQASRTSALAF